MIQGGHALRSDAGAHFRPSRPELLQGRSYSAEVLERLERARLPQEFLLSKLTALRTDRPKDGIDTAAAWQIVQQARFEASDVLAPCKRSVLLRGRARIQLADVRAKNRGDLTRLVFTETFSPWLAEAASAKLTIGGHTITPSSLTGFEEIPWLWPAWTLMNGTKSDLFVARDGRISWFIVFPTGAWFLRAVETPRKEWGRDFMSGQIVAPSVDDQTQCVDIDSHMRRFPRTCWETKAIDGRHLSRWLSALEKMSTSRLVELSPSSIGWLVWDIGSGRWDSAKGAHT